MAKTYYDILGVNEDVDVATIRRAYRRAMLDNHPDVNDKGNDRRSRELNAALETLTNPDRRKQYDEQLRNRRSRQHERSAPKQEPKTEMPPDINTSHSPVRKRTAGNTRLVAQVLFGGLAGIAIAVLILQVVNSTPNPESVASEKETQKDRDEQEKKPGSKKKQIGKLDRELEKTKRQLKEAKAKVADQKKRIGSLNRELASKDQQLKDSERVVADQKKSLASKQRRIRDLEAQLRESEKTVAILKRKPGNAKIEGKWRVRYTNGAHHDVVFAKGKATFIGVEKIKGSYKFIGKRRVFFTWTADAPKQEFWMIDGDLAYIEHRNSAQPRTLIMAFAKRMKKNRGQIKKEAKRGKRK